MPKHSSVHQATKLSQLERSTANAAGVISAAVCKGADQRYGERATQRSSANNAALYIQMYLLVDTLGWSLHRAALVSPFTAREVLDIVAEVNRQRGACTEVDTQLRRAEVFMWECVPESE